MKATMIGNALSLTVSYIIWYKYTIVCSVVIPSGTLGSPHKWMRTELA